MRDSLADRLLVDAETRERRQRAWTEALRQEAEAHPRMLPDGRDATPEPPIGPDMALAARIRAGIWRCCPGWIASKSCPDCGRRPGQIVRPS